MGLAVDPAAALTCARTGKALMTKSCAKSTAKRMAKRGHSLRLEAYRCQHCGKWHVGNRRHFS